MLKTGGILAMGAAAAAMLLTQPAEAQQPQRADPVLRCVDAVLHFTERGFAFECINERNTGSQLLVVRDGQFTGRTEMVVETLKEVNSTSYGAGRTRGVRGLWVTHRSPDGAAQAVCNLVTPRFPGANCTIAVDIAYR